MFQPFRRMAEFEIHQVKSNGEVNFEGKQGGFKSFEEQNELQNWRHHHFRTKKTAELKPKKTQTRFSKKNQSSELSPIAKPQLSQTKKNPQNF
jgi:hypothetical protein